MDLKGKKALVVGGTRGIGSAVAKTFEDKGAQVWVAAREKKESPHPFITLDLTDTDSIQKATDQIQRDMGSPDIIFFSGSSPKSGPLIDLEKDDWRVGLDLLITGPLAIAKAFLPNMKENNYGRLIFMSSAAAKKLIPGLELSSALRAALRSVVRSLSNAYCKSGITVNALLPALVDTEHLRTTAGSLEKLKTWEEMVPMGRFAKVEEIGALAAFLSSEKGSYITAQSLSIDGGFADGI